MLDLTYDEIDKVSTLIEKDYKDIVSCLQICYKLKIAVGGNHIL